MYSRRLNGLVLSFVLLLAAALRLPHPDWDGGIAAHPYLTAPETLADPDMMANGHVLTLNGVTQLGPVARLTRTPAQITAEAKPAVDASWHPGTHAGVPDTLPLAGVTVLELATIIASPLGASFLADMGARVIKVEAIGGDPYRHMAGGIGATRCNQGKESISVDLKDPEGQRIVRSLAEKADVVAIPLEWYLQLWVPDKPIRVRR